MTYQKATKLAHKAWGGVYLVRRDEDMKDGTKVWAVTLHCPGGPLGFVLDDGRCYDPVGKGFFRVD